MNKQRLLYNKVSKELTHCVPHRLKRSVLGEGLTSVVQRFGASATNWLLGVSNLASESNGVILAMDMVKRLWEHTWEKHLNRTLVSPDHGRENICQVSSSVCQHPEELQKFLEQRDYMRATIEYVDDKLDAAVILVNAIINKCREGKLDTQALGELLNSDELRKLDPERTIIRSITHDMKNYLIHLSYEIIVETGLFDNINYNLVAVVLLFLGLMVTITTTFVVIKNKLSAINNMHNQQQESINLELRQLRNSVAGSVSDGFDYMPTPPPPVQDDGGHNVGSGSELQNQQGVSNSGGRVEESMRTSIVSRVYE
jgi:hypothetical protein